MSTESTNELTTFAMAHALHQEGYYIGPRDYKRNKIFNGKWMVCENVDYPNETLDAGAGGFCIVGDNLTDLITTAFNNLI